MARYTEAKCKLCRREREKLFLKGLRCYTEKCGFERRRYPPGIHGESRRTRISIYGLQLREKQKVKRIYGVMESQFRRYFKLARRIGGNTGANFLSLLERRLDNVCYLLGFAYSRSQARQLISHGHILVNGKKLDIPSYIVEEGDTISVKNGSKGIPFIEESVTEREKGGIPGWLSLDKTSLSGKVIKLPSREDITHPINERLIVELYSR